MFIYNMKFNSKNIFKTCFIILFSVIIILFSIILYKVLFSKNTEKSCCESSNKVNVISSSSYTNILKAVHENIDNYVGKNIKFTGYVYRLYDFSDEQFVLAREMVISSDFQAVVVGFLCHLNEAKNYKDGCWVEIEGTITKGDYHGKIPVIEIYKIKEVSAPNDEYVYPPDETYVKTLETL